MVSDAHMLSLLVDRLVFVSLFMGLGEVMEVRAKRTGFRGTRIGLTTHRAPERKGFGAIRARIAFSPADHGHPLAHAQICI